MKTALFDFDLPPERIAIRPVSPRDASRMLVVEREGLEDRTVRELPELLQPGDLMVFNDTKVIPARLEARRGEARIEVMLHKYRGGNAWSAFARPGKRVRIGDSLSFGDSLTATVKAKHEDGEIELEWDSDAWREYVSRHGHMPLPPYIKRSDEAADKESYQTVYAAREGAVAAPTAGLHFTPELLAALDARGIERVQVTLHVGAGTFKPVKTEDTDAHVMHTEYFEISHETAAAVNAARDEGRRVIAVGTTSLRALESAADGEGRITAQTGETGIFITPGYRFKAVDVLMTNFHLPRSTLFMLVSAFAGLEQMQAAYRHAIAGEYRFYSYGDACLLFKQ